MPRQKPSRAERGDPPRDTPLAWAPEPARRSADVRGPPPTFTELKTQVPTPRRSTRGPRLETATALSNVIPGWARIGRTNQAFDSRLLHFEARLPRLQVKRPRGWAHVLAATEAALAGLRAAPSLRPRRGRRGRLSPPGRARGGCVPGLPAFVLQKPPLKCPVRLSPFDVLLHPFSSRLLMSQLPCLPRSRYQIRSRGSQTHRRVTGVGTAMKSFSFLLFSRLEGVWRFEDGSPSLWLLSPPGRSGSRGR